MALDAATAQDLIRKLTEDRDAYLDSVNRTTELLLQAIAATGSTTLPQLTPEVLRRNTISTAEIESIHKSSTFTGEEDSDSEDGESYFAQTPLLPESYNEAGLKSHLRHYPWTQEGRKILKGVLENDTLLRQQSVFPSSLGPVPDRSHLTHYSIFDVTGDGVPLPVRSAFDKGPESRAKQVWNRLKSTNGDPSREKKAVGRITIVREPSPLLFGALHYTMQKHFDMDEVFRFLVDHDPVLAHPHRAFSEDERHQRTFVFNMEYFTIIGEGCEPPHWQHADDCRDHTNTHIPISRCSSTIALSFEGPPASRVRNKNRRVSRRHGYIFDPFSPWRVLSIQCYPDWHSSIETHDSTKNYVNGPEAFLVTIRSEFSDATKRLMAVYRSITDLVEPPPDFIFSLDTRDKLLFEDTNFTYSRRYFWASQTLGIMNQDIHDMIETYQETFKDSIWDGTDKVVWGDGNGAGDEASSRRANWRKRMAMLRRDIGLEIIRLQEIERMNEKRMRIIKTLHDNLFSGTSVHESRRSVEQAFIAVEQGRNIKVLTICTIAFLPLTFVTSVYGMTNMPPDDPFSHFAITTLAICVPTYILIGTLTWQSGLKWWRNKPRTMYIWVALQIAMLFNRTRWAQALQKKRSEEQDDPLAARPRQVRSQSTEMAMLSRDVLADMPLISPQPTKNGLVSAETPDGFDQITTVAQTYSGVQETITNKSSPSAVRFNTDADFERLPPKTTIRVKEKARAPFSQDHRRMEDSASVVPNSGAEKRIKPALANIEGSESVADLRKGSLAGFTEFWNWQRGGRGTVSQADNV